jgi:hypothetical protein
MIVFPKSLEHAHWFSVQWFGNVKFSQKLDPRVMLSYYYIIGGVQRAPPPGGWNSLGVFAA